MATGNCLCLSFTVPNIKAYVGVQHGHDMATGNCLCLSITVPSYIRHCDTQYKMISLLFALFCLI
jgi:hypothetical protein